MSENTCSKNQRRCSPFPLGHFIQKYAFLQADITFIFLSPEQGFLASTPQVRIKLMGFKCVFAEMEKEPSVMTMYKNVPTIGNLRNHELQKNQMQPGIMKSNVRDAGQNHIHVKIGSLPFCLKYEALSVCVLFLQTQEFREIFLYFNKIYWQI